MRRAAGRQTADRAVATVLAALVIAALVIAALDIAAPIEATAAPLSAPRPTSGAASPDTPDPHPPAGGRAPDGSVLGGPRLAGRGVLLPAHAPRLPAGLTATAWVLVDLDAGTVLAARDPHGRYQPASILKTLTAVTLLPSLPGRRVVAVSTSAAATEGSAVGLLAGARYTVDQLFQALLLVSANDAAVALAEANGGVARTVAQMNAKARALGAYDTVVQTPSGLDGWRQLTSAYDMALVLRAAVASARFVHYDRTPSAGFPPRASRHGVVGAYQFVNQSLDFLQGYRGALVAKTGYTDAALHTYLGAAQRGGRRLGVVFLRNRRAPFDQYQQAERLLDWGYALPGGTAPVGTLGTASSAAAAGASGSGPAATTAPPTARTAAPQTADPAAGSGRPDADRTGVHGPAVTGAVLPVLGAFGVGLTLMRRRRARRRR